MGHHGKMDTEGEGKIMTRPRFCLGTLTGSLLLYAFLVMLPLSACTRQEGRPIPEATVQTLKIGTTTEQDVLKRLGPPESKKRLLGEELWTYRHVLHQGFASVETKIRILRLRFDDRGILQNIEQKNRKYESLF